MFTEAIEITKKKVKDVSQLSPRELRRLIFWERNLGESYYNLGMITFHMLNTFWVHFGYILGTFRVHILVLSYLGSCSFRFDQILGKFEMATTHLEKALSLLELAVNSSTYLTAARAEKKQKDKEVGQRGRGRGRG
jgi:hypothetical protein